MSNTFTVWQYSQKDIFLIFFSLIYKQNLLYKPYTQFLNQVIIKKYRTMNERIQHEQTGKKKAPVIDQHNKSRSDTRPTLNVPPQFVQNFYDNDLQNNQSENQSPLLNVFGIRNNSHSVVELITEIDRYQVEPEQTDKSASQKEPVNFKNKWKHFFREYIKWLCQWLSEDPDKNPGYNLENLKKNFDKKKDPNSYSQLRNSLDYKKNSFVFDTAVQYLKSQYEQNIELKRDKKLHEHFCRHLKTLMTSRQENKDFSKISRQINKKESKYGDKLLGSSISELIPIDMDAPSLESEEIIFLTKKSEQIFKDNEFE